ncbi:hypothetical protein PORCAN_1076 [Porphyromonas crevioricanis JCM 13913]|nr:hypothetical protein PORCAN_1076 [Porphyromonas crevioricanis JCM 13913]
MFYAARIRFCCIKPLLLQRAEKLRSRFFLEEKISCFECRVCRETLKSKVRNENEEN